MSDTSLVGIVGNRGVTYQETVAITSGAQVKTLKCGPLYQLPLDRPTPSKPLAWHPTGTYQETVAITSGAQIQKGSNVDICTSFF